MKKNLIFIILMLLLVIPVKANAETAIVKTEKEFLDNIPFTTNKITDVILGDDITVTNTVVFYLTKNSSLDLNGHTLTFNSDRDFFVKSNCTNCTMTFKDSSKNNAGKLIMKKNQILISPSDGACLTTNTVIDGGTYEQIESSTERGTFKLVHQCKSDDNKENLTIKNGVFNTNEIFWGEKNAIVKIESLTQNRSRTTADFRIGFFNNTMAISSFNDIISPNSEVLYDGILETNWTKSLSDRLGNKTIVVRRKMSMNVDNVTFESKEEGYSNITPKNINITNTGLNVAKIKSISISNENDFKLNVSNYKDIEVNMSDDSYSLYPVNGLTVGKYETKIIVVDINDKTYEATATFEVTSKQNDEDLETDNNNENNNDNNSDNSNDDNKENLDSENKDENSQPENNNDKPNNNDDSSKKEETTDNNKNNKLENPKTSDEIGSSIFIIILSLVGLTVTIICLIKRKMTI